MAAANKIEKLIAVKHMLAEKYLHFAHLAGSKPKRHTFIQKSNRYRRQAATLQAITGAKAE